MQNRVPNTRCCVKTSQASPDSKVRVKAGTTLGTIRNPDRENQTGSEECSQNDSDPELATSINRSSHSVKSDHDTVFHILKSYTKMEVVNKVSVFQSHSKFFFDVTAERPKQATEISESIKKARFNSTTVFWFLRHDDHAK